jgi:hypothetical protein
MVTRLRFMLTLRIPGSPRIRKPAQATAAAAAERWSVTSFPSSQPAAVRTGTVATPIFRVVVGGLHAWVRVDCSTRCWVQLARPRAGIPRADLLQASSSAPSARTRTCATGESDRADAHPKFSRRRRSTHLDTCATVRHTRSSAEPRAARTACKRARQTLF